MLQTDHRPGLGRDPHERAVADELQIATGARQHHASGLRHAPVQLRHRRTLCCHGAAATRAPIAALGLDGARQVMPDAGDHVRQLDRGRDVVDEVDEHAEIDDDQDERDRDRQMRHEVAVGAGPDRGESQHRVDERGDERAERQLRASVADEVAQHPWPELGRGQRERHDHDREHDADDRDDRGRERRQDLPRGVGVAAIHPRGQRQVAVVGRPVDRVRQDEQEDGRDDLDGRHDPQVRAQRLAAPLGREREATREGDRQWTRRQGAFDADQSSRLTDCGV